MNYLIYFIITIFFFFIFFKIYKSREKFLKNKKENISGLTYRYVDYNVPHNELLYYFVENYNKKYKDFFKKIDSLQKKPVYTIKKINDKYEYEIYFYKWDHSRYKDKSKQNLFEKNYVKNEKIKNLELLLNYEHKLFNNNNTVKKEDFDSIYIKPYLNKLFKENEYNILSFDINDDFFKNKEHVYNYYYTYDDDIYKFIVKEEYPNGNIIETNKYCLFYNKFNIKDKNKFFIDKFECPGCIIFYAYKTKTKADSIYITELLFDKFIYFLKYLKYDEKIIKFCQNNYNDTNKFTISYDVLDNKILKSCITSIFN